MTDHPSDETDDSRDRTASDQPDDTEPLTSTGRVGDPSGTGDTGTDPDAATGGADADDGEERMVSVDFDDLPEDVQRSLLEEEQESDEGLPDEFFEDLSEANRAKFAEAGELPGDDAAGGDDYAGGEQPIAEAPTAEGDTDPPSRQTATGDASPHPARSGSGTPAATSTGTGGAQQATSGTPGERLKELRELYAAGEITDEQFDQHVDELLAPDAPTDTTADDEAIEEAGLTREEVVRADRAVNTTADSDDEEDEEDVYETQDFSALEETADPREVEVRGAKFLLMDPSEQDEESSTLNDVAGDLQNALQEYQDPATGQLDPERLDEEGLDVLMKSMVRTVVAKPYITDEMWADWQRGPKMGLMNAVRQYTEEYVSGFTMRPVSGGERAGPGFRG